MSPVLDFDGFWNVVEQDLLRHPVIVSNPYTKKFRLGPTTEMFVDMVEQFSVFSNHFLPIQCERMVNANTEAGEKGARVILANEIGVALDMAKADTDGKIFHHNGAHINWLRGVGSMLGLNPRSLGRWELGSKSTHQFLNELRESYGSRDGNIGAGASFAIETWAAWGIGKGPEAESNNFWRELVEGIRMYNERVRKTAGLPPVTTSFFQYHFDIESVHGANVMEELRETFNDPAFNQKRWFSGGRKALNAIHTFWLGLELNRRRLDSLDKLHDIVKNAVPASKKGGL